MFGKGKLLRDGAEAQGVVIDALIATSGEGGTVDKYKVTVRVKFEDGSVAEVSEHLFRHKVGYHTEGAILPVRYDVGDRSKVEIDVPKLEAQLASRTAATKAAAIEQAERELEIQASGFAAGDGPSGNPRVDMLRLSIRQAMRNGDNAEVQRLTAALAEIEDPA